MEKRRGLPTKGLHPLRKILAGIVTYEIRKKIPATEVGTVIYKSGSGEYDQAVRRTVLPDGTKAEFYFNGRRGRGIARLQYPDGEVRVTSGPMAFPTESTQ